MYTFIFIVKDYLVQHQLASGTDWNLYWLSLQLIMLKLHQHFGNQTCKASTPIQLVICNLQHIILALYYFLKSIQSNYSWTAILTLFSNGVFVNLIYKNSFCSITLKCLKEKQY